MRTFTFTETELRHLMTEVAEAGARRALETTTSATLSLRAVYKLFQDHGYRPCDADKLIEQGELVGIRKGTGRNSKVMFSEARVLDALSAKRLSTKFANNKS